MHHAIFTVFDVKVGAYLPPFLMQSKAQAIRTVGDTMADPEHPFSKHPEDYTLFFLGHFDDVTGTFEIEDIKQSLAVLVELTAAYQESIL